MEKYIEKRVMDEAFLIKSTHKTVRDVALLFGVSKSTVHKDMQERLEGINKGLYDDIMLIFEEHIRLRHIRGGEATRVKYLKL